jgi:hypothetical protein
MRLVEILLSVLVCFNLWAQKTDLEKNMPLSKFKGTKNVTSTIVITKPGTYDFKNVLHIWKGKDWKCADEKENGPQILRIEASNVVVKNFAFVGDGKSYGSKGLGDPIHITTCGKGQGYDCPPGMENITLDKIEGNGCEDLINIGTPNTKNITIQNSTFWPNPKPQDKSKLLYVNYGKNLIIRNNIFHGIKGVVRAIRIMPNNSALIENNTFDSLSIGVQFTSEVTFPDRIKPGPTTIQFKGNKFTNTKVQGNCDFKNDIYGDGVYVCDEGL